MTVLSAPLAPDLLPESSGSLAGRPPSTDAQISALRDLLASRPQAALSLDCFDTILWRAVPKPTDVFMMIGERLLEHGLLRKEISPRLFTRMRVLAEQAARSQAFVSTRSTEVSLPDIYSHHGWTRYTFLAPAELARHELIVESMVTTADPWFAELLTEISQSDVDRRLIVVSDTYFDVASMRFLLRSAGLDSLDDGPIFVSSEIGVSKAEGLLEKALTSVGVDPTDCIHVGNSFASDVQPAIKVGASYVHVPEAAPLAHRAFGVEGWLPGGAEVSPLLDPVAGDSGLTALRGRINRHRPDSVGTADAVFWEVGATTLGPVLTGFAEWVHERAGELGIETALCLMREGRLLAQLLDSVPADSRTCSAVPFWASREACLRASFFTGSKDELQRVLWRVDPPGVDDVLKTAGLTERDLPPNFRTVIQRGVGQTPADLAGEFVDYLAAKEDLRQLIVRRSKERRQAYVAYLMDSLVGRSRTVALVDLGFGATIQEMLHQMVISEGIKLDFRGLYLYTTQRALIRQLGGHLVEGFLADAGTTTADMAALDRSPEILEVTTTSPDGSLLEVAPGGTPLLARRGPLGDQDRQRAMVQEGIRSFQNEWNYFSSHSSLANQRKLGRSPQQLHRILHRFVSRPGAAVARAFSEWEHEANFGSERTDRLVPEVVERSVGYLAPENLVMSKPTDLYWVGAAASLFDFEDEVAWLQEAQVPLGKFVHTGDPAELVISAARADGTEAPLTKMPVLWHKTGQGAIAWSGRSSHHSYILRVCSGKAVIRLDRVTVAYEDGTVQTMEWDKARSECPPGITVVAEGPVGEGLVRLSDSCGAVLSLTAPRPSAVTSMEILYSAMLG